MINIGLLVFDEVEILDFTGPLQVFTTAARLLKSERLSPNQLSKLQANQNQAHALNSKRHNDLKTGHADHTDHSQQIFNTFTIGAAATTQQITARGASPLGALTFNADYALTQHPPLDVLLIPGGIVDHICNDQLVIDWLQRQSKTTPIIASICTGAFLLGRAGLLDHLTITTHWEDIADLKKQFPNAKVVEDQRWTENTVQHPLLKQQTIITAAGIAAGIDMSLELVAKLASEELAVLTARQMEYPYLSK